jgi:hypothetical protein
MAGLNVLICGGGIAGVEGLCACVGWLASASN